MAGYTRGSLWSDGAATPAAKALTLTYVVGDEIFIANEVDLYVHCTVSGTAPTSVDLQLEASIDHGSTWEVMPIPGNDAITDDAILHFILKAHTYYRFSAKRTGGAADTKLLAMGHVAIALASPLPIDQTGSVVVGTAGSTVAVEGDTAHDDADAGNPVKIGGKADTGTPAVVADGDRVDAWFDEYGRLHVYDENGSSAAAGDVAHDAADAGNPVKMGFRARTSQIAAVANNDRSDAISNAYGEQAIAGYDWTLDSNRSNETNPLSEQYASHEFEETNIAQGTTAYHYIDMAGYQHCCITGTNVPATDGQTITIEATCQDDGTAAASCTYVDITQYGVDWLTGAAAASNTTGNFGWAISEASNFKYVRIKYVTGSSGGNDADHNIYVKKWY